MAGPERVITTRDLRRQMASITSAMNLFRSLSFNVMDKIRKVMAVILVAVLMVAMYICVADKAYWFHLGQYAYNIIFFAVIMPACVTGVLKCYGYYNL